MIRFRMKRFEIFFDLFGITEDSRILDVGGLPHDWLALGFKGHVTCISLSNLREGMYGNGNILYQNQDARYLPYQEGKFDVVYSNSLLEHVGRSNQVLIADEIRRVSNKRYWVQVPYRYFLFEPHYKFPFFWYFPHTIRRLIARYWTGTVRKKNYYLSEIDTIYLPVEEELENLFSEGNLFEEKFYGLTKSLVIWHK